MYRSVYSCASLRQSVLEELIKWDQICSNIFEIFNVRNDEKLCRKFNLKTVQIELIVFRWNANFSRLIGAILSAFLFLPAPFRPFVVSIFIDLHAFCSEGPFYHLQVHKGCSCEILFYMNNSKCINRYKDWSPSTLLKNSVC